MTEADDLLLRFMDELAKPTGDGQQKRKNGKPPWYVDTDHHRAMFSHYHKWLAGEKVDPDSGAHPLVHAAWRCLAIACQETGNVPKADKWTQESWERAYGEATQWRDWQTCEQMLAERESESWYTPVLTDQAEVL